MDLFLEIIYTLRQARVGDARSIGNYINNNGITKPKGEITVSEKEVLTEVKKHPNTFWHGNMGLIGLTKHDESGDKTNYAEMLERLLSIPKSKGISVDYQLLYQQLSIVTINYWIRVLMLHGNIDLNIDDQFKVYALDQLIKNAKGQSLKEFYVSNMGTIVIAHAALFKSNSVVIEMDEIVKSYDEKTLEQQLKIISEYSWRFDRLKEIAEAITAFTVQFAQKERVDNYISCDPRIVDLFSRLAGIRKDEKVFDGNAGLGDLVIGVADKTKEIYAHELYEETVKLGALNFMLNGVSPNNYSKGWPLTYSIIQESTIDWVLSVPPLGRALFQSLSYGYSDFIDYYISRLNSNGRALLLVAEGLLFGRGKKENALKERLIKEDILEAVISLPGGIYKATGIKTSVLYLNKNKPHNKKGQVLFIEAPHEGIGKSLTIDSEAVAEMFNSYAEVPGDAAIVNHITIEENDWNLEVSRYATDTPQWLREKELEGFKLVRLDNLLKVDNNAAKGSANDVSENTPYVSIKHLNNEFQKLFLDINNIKKDIAKKDDKLAKELTGPLLLVARVGKELKPTLVKKDEHVLVSNNVFAFKIENDDLLPEYLIWEMQEEYFKAQYRNVLKGAAQQTWVLDDFRSLKIALPPLRQQLEILNERKAAFIEEKQKAVDKEIELLGASKRNQESQTIAFIKHSIINSLQAVNNDISNIKKRLARAEEEQKIVSLGETITPNSSRTINDLFESISRNINHSNSIFDQTEMIVRLDFEKLIFQEVDLVEFFKNETKSYLGLLPGLKIVVKGLNTVAPILIQPMKTVIENLIVNSVKHGFTPFTSDKSFQPTIIIFIGSDEENGIATIRYFENGIGFKPGFDFNRVIKFGDRADKEKGSGLGGFIINRIIELHSGSFDGSMVCAETKDIPPSPKRIEIADGKTIIGIQFSIELPLKQTK